jgi:hypothetical protein
VKEVVVNESAPIRFYGTISRCRLMENSIGEDCGLERLLEMRGLLKATQSKQGPSTYRQTHDAVIAVIAVIISQLSIISISILSWDDIIDLGVVESC